MTARHSLDGVELVASLVRHDPGLVQLWYTEWLIPEIGEGINPDQLVVLDTGDASALMLVEVDESTERPPIIRERLKAYAHLFVTHPTGWHLLWIVNSPDRLLRIRQIAGPMKLQPLAGRCWGVATGDVTESGASAEVLPVGFSGAAQPLRSIAVDPLARRMTPIPGTSEWVAFIAAGALEPWTAAVRSGTPRFETADIPTTVAAEVAAQTPVANQASPNADRDGLAGEGHRELGPALTISQTLPELDAVLRHWMPRELAELILARDSDPERAVEAARILAAQSEWNQLHGVLRALCESSEHERAALGIAIIDRVRVPDDWLHRIYRELLLKLIEPDRGPAIIDAALTALAHLAEDRR